MDNSFIEQLQSASKETFPVLIESFKKDHKRLNQLVDLAVGDDKLLARNSGFVLFKITEEYPELSDGYTSYIMERLPELSHNSQLGLLLEVLKVSNRSAEDLGPAIDFAFNALDLGEAYEFTKFCAIQFLDAVCEQEPDLKREFRLKLEMQLPYFKKDYLRMAAEKIVNGRM